MQEGLKPPSITQPDCSSQMINLIFTFHEIEFNPLTAATSLGFKRFRVLNTTINIKDILGRLSGNYTFD
jgi:hypothetical protein